MYHPCACCRLRFATSGELAAHVRAEHAPEPAEETRDVVEVSRPHFDWAAHRTAFSAGTSGPSSH